MSLLLPTRSVEKVWGLDTLPPPFAAADGERIGEIWFEPPPELPELLVKYIFASEKLSIQTHPNDAQTQAQGIGRQGKEECWLILDAEPGATIAAGFRQAVDADTMRAAARDGSIEDMLVWHEVSAGDFFYIPANTVHAIGGGVSLLEVQDFRGAVVATATATSRRRTGKTPPGTPLTDAARMRPTSWSNAVAYAFWKAEKERSKSTNLPFCLEVAAKGFERNPFEWTAEADERASQSKVVFAWEWFKDGCWYRELTYVRCYDLLTHGRDVPPPFELCDVSAFWWQELEEAAAKVEFVRCTYLGRDMGGGRFEKDPAKWPPWNRDPGEPKLPKSTWV